MIPDHRKTAAIRASRVLAVVAALFLNPLSAQAQFVTNSLAGRSGSSSDEGSFSSAESSMEQALWTAGAFRLDPWLGIRDAGFVDNLSISVREDGVQTPTQLFDFRVVAGAGLRAYVPLGAHVIWSANVLEEYNAWAGNTDRNRWASSWGTGLFVEGNRASFDVRASSRETQDFTTSEVEILTQQVRDFLNASFETRMVRSLYLWARASDGEIRQEALEETAQPIVGQLDRDEQSASAGLRFQLGSTMNLSVGYKDTETDFFGTSDRSNEATAPLLDFTYRGHNLVYDMRLAYYDVVPKEGALLEPFQELNAQLRLVINPEGRFDVTPYLRRHANYSVTSEFSHFIQARLGVRFGIPIATRMRLELFAEGGTDDYSPFSDSDIGDRTDDVTAWGGSFSIPLNERVSLRISGQSEDFSSEFPNADRTRTRIGLGIGLGLGLGDVGGLDWASWP
jgi:hypothetical protein